MNATTVVRRLHEHRRWVNGQLMALVRPLSREQLQQSLPIGQGSVWRTLTHLYAAEFVWLEALLGDDNPLLPGDTPDALPGNQAGAGALDSLDELGRRWRDLDTRWQDYLAGLRDHDLQQLVYKISTSSGKGRRHATSRLDVLLHVCTHAQYTTAQLVNMLRQLGVSPLPDAMLITLARQQAKDTGVSGS